MAPSLYRGTKLFEGAAKEKKTPSSFQLLPSPDLVPPREMRPDPLRSHIPSPHLESFPSPGAQFSKQGPGPTLPLLPSSSTRPAAARSPGTQPGQETELSLPSGFLPPTSFVHAQVTLFP